MLSGCARRPVRHGPESGSPRVNSKTRNPKSEEPPPPTPHTTKSRGAAREVREQRKSGCPPGPTLKSQKRTACLIPPRTQSHVPLDKCEATLWASPSPWFCRTPRQLKWLGLVRFRLLPSPRLPNGTGLRGTVRLASSQCPKIPVRAPRPRLQSQVLVTPNVQLDSFIIEPKSPSPVRLDSRISHE